MAEKRIKNELDTDYRIIGIATSLKEYKLCYHLNQLLDCDFRKVDDVVFETTDRTRTSQFSVFKANTTDEQIQYLVFSNKNPGEVLLPELSNFDYLLQITGQSDSTFIQNTVECIKKFPEVVLTMEIPLKKIKSKERLVYEEKKMPRKLITPKRFNK